MMEIIRIEPAFVDDRGSIWDLLPQQDIKHVGLLISKKGSTRAQHYHKNQIQFTLVLQGKMKVITKDVRNTNSDMETCEMGEMEILVSPPYQYHSFEFLEDSKCITFSTGKHSGEDYENDTIRVKDILSFSLDKNN